MSSLEFSPMDQWDQRDETVLLMVDYTGHGEHALDDASHHIAREREPKA